MRGSCRLSGISYKRKHKSRANRKFIVKFQIYNDNMAKYINPMVVKAAMQELEEYKSKFPNEKTPLFNVAEKFNDDTRAAYVRAAQRMKWNVVRTRGHVYENGLYLW